MSALKFEFDREKNLFALLDELNNRTYKISPHICFIIKEPTPREIFAADFRDRIVHHLLCNEIAYLFEKDFIENSFANRKYKGTHKAVECLKKELQSGGYFLKLDVQAFFRSIDRNIMFRLVKDKIIYLRKDAVWTDDILWLCELIIFHDPVIDSIYRGDESKKSLIPASKSLFYSQGKGLPIGNLTSQFFGNVYLNELDQYIKKLDFRYVRYVDDFVLLSESKEQLLLMIPKIECFLKQKLNLAIHPKKIILQNVSKGVDFLGYFVRPSYTLIRRKVVARFKKKLWNRNNDIAMLNSYFGHFLHANTYELRKSICDKLSFLKFDKQFRKFISI